MVPAIGSRANAKILTARPAGLRHLPLQDDLVYYHGQPVAMGPRRDGGDARRRAGGNNLPRARLDSAIRTRHRNPNAAMRTLVRCSRAACSSPCRQKGASVARLAAISPTTHHVFLSQTSQLPAGAALPFAAEWVHKVEACRQSRTQTRPEVLVMIGSDCFHQLWLSSMPQFLGGTAPLSRSRHQHLTLPGGTP
jgi:hypothetical protein